MRIACLLVFLPIFGFTQPKASGQEAPAAIKPLAIGDTVPDVVLENIINYPSSSARLSHFKGKLLILDFWATWCTACLNNFHKLDSLQKASREELKVLLVNGKNTGDDSSKVKGFYSRWKEGRGDLSLPTVVGDTVLRRFFPHRLLPHYVWIDSNMRVAAITGSEELTASNVAGFLSGNNLPFRVKQDVLNYKPATFLLETNNGNPKSALICQTTLTKRLEGFPTGASKYGNGSIRKTSYFNHSILQLYLAATGMQANRLRLVTCDSSRFIIDKETENGQTAFQYCYEITVPPATQKDVEGEIMLADFNRSFQLNGRVEKRLVDCWVLTVADGRKLKVKASAYKEKERGTWRLKNQPLVVLERVLNAQLPGEPLKPIVLDETGYAGRVDLVIKSNLGDLPAVALELSEYGLKLQKQPREVELLIIEDK